MKTYDTIIDLLNFEGPGLQDYVTAEQLQELIDGTLAPAAIADNYLADLAVGTLVAVATDAAETRADLLTWIRWEIEIAVQQRKQQARDDAMIASLNDLQAMATAEKRMLSAVHANKLTLIAEARRHGASKAALADALGISRPTLDKMLAEQEDRALFDRAAFELGKTPSASSFEGTLNGIVAIRDTSKQARTILAVVAECDLLDLSENGRHYVERAIKRANELL